MPEVRSSAPEATQDQRRAVLPRARRTPIILRRHPAMASPAASLAARPPHPLPADIKEAAVVALVAILRAELKL